MRILIVSATEAEIAPIIDAIRPETARDPRLRSGRIASHDVDVLVAGVGMVATAVWSAAALTNTRYSFALNLGLCGSFDLAIPLRTVVHVVSDRLSELGAEDGDGFLPIHELGLLNPDEPPFSGGAIVNQSPPANGPLASLPSASGITVNTVHGRDESIAAVRRRFDPQVESMEGAAFMYACAVNGVPYAQVRAVSNVVERRNRAAWQIGPAVAALSVSALAILESA